jgi:hypothetical protein
MPTMVQSAAMAIFDGGGRQGRERGGCTSRGAPGWNKAWVSKAGRRTLQRQTANWRETYGISDGVSGFDGAGGRLMNIGCDACDACNGCCAILSRLL